MKNSFQALSEKLGLGLAQNYINNEQFGSFVQVNSLGGLNSIAYREAANRILLGYYNIFALKNTYIGFPPNWNKDPKTKIIAPLSAGSV